MTPALQFLVQVVQQDVGEQRRQGAALRRTDRRRFDALADQDTRPQVPGNQGQQPFVAHLPGHSGHQDVVRDIVKELDRCAGHRRVGQISPNKDINFQCRIAAFTLSPVPGGLRQLVLTRPGTAPSIRFLSVGSHLCARVSSRQALADLPLPSAFSSRLSRCSHLDCRATPHQIMPMSGVHNRLHSDRFSAASRLQTGG